MDGFDFGRHAGDVVSFVASLPLGATLVVLGAVAAGEYVAPPLPGDAVIVASGILAARGGPHVSILWCALTAGAVAGACGAWAVGRAGERSPRVRAFLTRVLGGDRFARTLAFVRRHGVGAVLLNRFLPGIRGPLLFVAGSAGVPLSTIVVGGAISAGAWNALLLWLGFAFGERLEAIEAVMLRVGIGSWVLLAAVVLGIIVTTRLSRRRPTRPVL